MGSNTGLAEDGTRPAMKRRLGRGLNALLGSSQDEAGASGLSMTEPSSIGGRIKPASRPESDEIALELIERNPFQPRQEFEPEALDELTESIRVHGVLQPLLVRPHGDGYQLIAGERRWRSAQAAGLETIPCRVLTMDDQQICEAAIEENIKREDLNVLEKARAFQDYLDQFGGTIEQLSQRLSMKRSTVNNMLRLLDLPEPVQSAVRKDAISAGHARALLTLPEEAQKSLCGKIIKEGLSVRATEQLVRDIQNPESPKPAVDTSTNEAPALSNHVLSLQDHLREQLGAKIDIRLRKKDCGQIVIHFGSNDDFERIVDRIGKAA